MLRHHPLIKCATAALACRALDIVLTSTDQKYPPSSLMVLGARKRPVQSGELLFPPLTFLSFRGSSLLRSHGSYLNANHPFSAWLIDHAPELSDRYPGILEAIRKHLVNVPEYRMKPGEAIEALSGALQRLGELAPHLRLPRAQFPKLSDFPQ